LNWITSARKTQKSLSFPDVPADAYYADAVAYVKEHGLMNGISDTAFSPGETTSRGMIAAILYRVAGSPDFTGGTAFPDVADTAYYAAAIRWASANNIVDGYDNGNFGPDDPMTREQFATILWRYAGRPAAESGADFADEDSISSYAATAVDWARTNGIVNGVGGNRFDPKGNAIRAQAAIILQNYLELDAKSDTTPDDTTSSVSRVLVAYFSGSGNTETVAETIATILNADLFEITTVEPYTTDDLNWNISGSRVNREHENEALRDVALTTTTVENWSQYDTVLIGYPIWWGIAAWPVNGFVSANDFTGKTVIPFCTAYSSGIGQSGTLLEQLTGTGTWQTGHRFTERPSQADIESWVETLNLK
jgi:flavodoxin